MEIISINSSFSRIPCFFVLIFVDGCVCIKIYNLHELQNLGGYVWADFIGYFLIALTFYAPTFKTNSPTLRLEIAFV